MNEKKFIVVRCYELNDPYECDADREIDTNFYGQKQIEMLLESKIENYIYERNSIKFECYEITENGLKFRQDLSNYNR